LRTHSFSLLITFWWGLFLESLKIEYRLLRYLHHLVKGDLNLELSSLSRGKHASITKILPHLTVIHVSNWWKSVSLTLQILQNCIAFSRASYIGSFNSSADWFLGVVLVSLSLISMWGKDRFRWPHRGSIGCRRHVWIWIERPLHSRDFLKELWNSSRNIGPHSILTNNHP